ncbi:MAG: hypothetical protein QNJ44_11240, partial [Rhodobacter sp.]|nr:hypothetical protein [Rhodobacter sp.]
RQAAQRSGIPATGAGKHRSIGPETDHALTINPDHPMGALQNVFVAEHVLVCKLTYMPRFNDLNRIRKASAGDPI